MNYTGYSAYDDETFFEKYQQRRGKKDAPNEAIEQPVFDELLGDISGKTILDLGCGDGAYGVELPERGASFYYGVEGSQNMAGLAEKNLTRHNAEIKIADIENIGIHKRYDIVISRLVLHYLEDLKILFQKINGCLNHQGTFLFSVEHPVITSNYESYHKNDKRSNWIVDNYFDSGERTNNWHGKPVVKYHRTFEEYWKIIKNTQFEVVEMRESKPIPSNFESKEEYLRRKRIPLFLFFKLKGN